MNMRLKFTRGTIWVAMLGQSKHLWGQGNGLGRGDGWDVDCYQLSSGRYLVKTEHVASGCVWHYIAATADGARAVAQAGYTPGSAAGTYRYVRDWTRLAEARRARARLEHHARQMMS